MAMTAAQQAGAAARKHAGKSKRSVLSDPMSIEAQLSQEKYWTDILLQQRMVARRQVRLTFTEIQPIQLGVL